MAKSQGLSINDLLDAQRKLAAEGNEQAAKQVVRLEGIAKMFQEETAAEKKPAIADEKVVEPIKLLEKQTKKGLVDKTGDGLNSNVIKLSKDVRAIVKSLPGGAPSSAWPPVPAPQPAKYQKTKAVPRPRGDVEAARQERAGADIAGQTYYKSGFEAFGKIKGGIGALRRGGVQGIVAGARAGISNLTTNMLESTLDLSEGRSTGLLGTIARKKIAKSAYIRDEMKLNQSKNPEQQRRMLALRFEKKNEMVGKMQETQGEIERLRGVGATEEQLKKTGLLEKRAAIEKTAGILDPEYRKKRVPQPDAAKKAVGQSVEGLLGTPPAAPLTGSAEETQLENLKLFTEQNETLKKIEENTQLTAAAKVQPVSKEPIPEKESGGGLLSNIADVVKGKAGKVGTVLKTAGRFLGPAAAVAGAGFAGYQAGQWLNENTGIQSGIASGVETVKGWFGNSEEDKMKESESKAAQEAYSKRVSEGKLTEAGAKFFESRGVRVDRSKIVAGEAAKPVAPVPNLADNISSRSAANAAASTAVAAAPTVVNAPTSTVVNNNTTNVQKTQPRNTESSYREYNRSKYAY